MGILKYPLTLILREPLFFNAHIKKRSSKKSWNKIFVKNYMQGRGSDKKEKNSRRIPLFLQRTVLI